MGTAGCLSQECFFAEYIGRCSQNFATPPPLPQGREHFLLARTKTIPRWYAHDEKPILFFSTDFSPQQNLPENLYHALLRKQ
jgi:hypothetical protein